MAMVTDLEVIQTKRDSKVDLTQSVGAALLFAGKRIMGGSSSAISITFLTPLLYHIVSFRGANSCPTRGCLKNFSKLAQDQKRCRFGSIVQYLYDPEHANAFVMHVPRESGSPDSGLTIRDTRQY